MKRMYLFAAAAIALLPTAASAQWRDLNNEPTCLASGSGMDPRCVGDTFAGTFSDFTAVRRLPQPYFNLRTVGPQRAR
ncbi:MAG: hypothetical protein JWL62_3135 [Hyphomicrobiales bacterium]|nr:hypothetical protein [Hyphomicrobiales bacterium]